MQESRESPAPRTNPADEPTRVTGRITPQRAGPPGERRLDIDDPRGYSRYWGARDHFGPFDPGLTATELSRLIESAARAERHGTLLLWLDLLSIGGKEEWWMIEASLRRQHAGSSPDQPAAEDATRSVTAPGRAPKFLPFDTIYEPTNTAGTAGTAAAIEPTPWDGSIKSCEIALPFAFSFHGDDPREHLGDAIELILYSPCGLTPTHVIATVLDTRVLDSDPETDRIRLEVNFQVRSDGPINVSSASAPVIIEPGAIFTAVNTWNTRNWTPVGEAL